MKTPNVQRHLVERICDVMPGHFSARGSSQNIGIGDEAPRNGSNPSTWTAVRIVAARDEYVYYNGCAKRFELQILTRYAPGTDGDAWGVAIALHDALHLGAWTTRDGVTYTDLVYMDGPRIMTDRYIVHNVWIATNLGER